MAAVTTATASCRWRRWANCVGRPAGASTVMPRMRQAIAWVRRDGQPELKRLKRRLEQVYERNSGQVEARTCSGFRDPFMSTFPQAKVAQGVLVLR